MSHMTCQGCIWRRYLSLALSNIGMWCLQSSSTTPIPALRKFPGQAGHGPIAGGPSPPSTPGAPGQGQRLVPTACFGHAGKTISIDPHSPYLPGSFPCPGGQPGTPTGASTPLPWDAMPVPSPGRPCQYAHCCPDSVSLLGCQGWGTSRPDTPAYSFSPRCTGVTRRTWAPSPRTRQRGCGCRRGTRPGPATPPSCWSTPRAAVAPVVVRVTGTRTRVGTAPPRRSLDTAAHPTRQCRVSLAVMGHRRRGQCHLPGGQQGHNGPK